MELIPVNVFLEDVMEATVTFGIRSLALDDQCNEILTDYITGYISRNYSVSELIEHFSPALSGMLIGEFRVYKGNREKVNVKALVQSLISENPYWGDLKITRKKNQ